ncbi:MAG: hypothetical protein AB7V26_09850 [Lysobacterales bacterium]
MVLFCGLSLTACISSNSALPEGYDGMVAGVEDSFVKVSDGVTHYFCVATVDGKDVDNLLEVTRELRQNPVGYGREVVASKAIHLEIFGVEDRQPPIVAMFNKSRRVSGSVTFTPEHGTTYSVRGKITTERLEVWIEETMTGKIVTQIVQAGTHNTNPQ